MEGIGTKAANGRWERVRDVPSNKSYGLVLVRRAMYHSERAARGRTRQSKAERLLAVTFGLERRDIERREAAQPKGTRERRGEGCETQKRKRKNISRE